MGFLKKGKRKFKPPTFFNKENVPNSPNSINQNSQVQRQQQRPQRAQQETNVMSPSLLFS